MDNRLWRPQCKYEEIHTGRQQPHTHTHVQTLWQVKINQFWMAKITLNPDYEAEYGPGQRAATHFVR